MKQSYRKFNYGLRPAKNIERKMLAEAIKKIITFDPIDIYSYIGFGSIYFSDFKLFHRSLGIESMTSIEKDEHSKDRFEFNKPFQCVNIEFGNSNEILSKLEWDKKYIIWLDYDGNLDLNVLSDLQSCFTNCLPGSIIFFSFNASTPSSEEDRSTVDIIKDRIGENRFPNNIGIKDLDGWNTSKVFRKVVDNEIRETLSNRNGVLAKEDKLFYQQLFYFNYSDNAKMMTVGGIVVKENEQDIITNSRVTELPFVRVDDQAFKIEVPNLTYKELRYLESQLPRPNLQDLERNGIPDADVAKFASMYRYFPTFAETEI